MNSNQLSDAIKWVSKSSFIYKNDLSCINQEIEGNLFIEDCVFALGNFRVHGSVTCGSFVYIHCINVGDNFWADDFLSANFIEASGHVELGQNSQVLCVVANSLTVGYNSTVNKVKVAGTVRVPKDFNGTIVEAANIEYY